MKLVKKARSMWHVYQSDGIHRVLTILRTKYHVPIPQTAESRWKAELRTETGYWQGYFERAIATKDPELLKRLDPELPLQPRLAALLPKQDKVSILDVGAGPLTCVGKRLDGVDIQITAIDPLAPMYGRILAENGITPLVKTLAVQAEQLTAAFAQDSFDLVYSRNAIDHAHSPEAAILQMVSVVRRGQYVLLEHIANEADIQGYGGLHQWNFFASPSGDFMVGSKAGTTNVSVKYAHLFRATAEMFDEGVHHWVITRIRKV